MKLTDVALRRLRNQRLIGGLFDSPEEAVRSLTAVQAQDYAGAKWAIGQRVKGCTDAEVEAAYNRGAILRTHVMRPTWHFVVPEDIRWLLALTAPRVKQAMSSYDRKLELDAATYKRTNAAIVKALRGRRQMTRSELGRVLASAGIAAEGQRLGHIIMRAELDALICSGAMRGKQHMYALLRERAPVARTAPREEALVELARRYFESHGPAMAQDFAWWSGLTVADANAGIAMISGQLERDVVDGKTYWSEPSRNRARLPDPRAHLLPNYDEYLIAYRDHGASFAGPPPRGSAAMYDILARHIVVMNGMVIGGWRNARDMDSIAVETRLFVTLTEAQRRALREAAEAYSRFTGMPVIVRERRS